MKIAGEPPKQKAARLGDPAGTAKELRDILYKGLEHVVPRSEVGALMRVVPEVVRRANGHSGTEDLRLVVLGERYREAVLSALGNRERDGFIRLDLTRKVWSRFVDELPDSIQEGMQGGFPGSV